MKTLARMRCERRDLTGIPAIMLSCCLLSGFSAYAQDSSQPDRASAQHAPAQAAIASSPTGADADANTLAEIVVTATKSAGGSLLRDTPISMSAITSATLDQRNLRDLSVIAYSIPNVQLEGARGGTQNFSIRGQGMTSTIPSVDSIVGLFVDGVYYANGAGVVFDTFDLASIEVLRGPQGLLFGRNATAGAVLLNTTKPTDELTASAKASLETGTDYTLTGRISGPLTQDHALTGKLAIYYQHDDGYFRNLYDGSKFGRNKQLVIRSALRHVAGSVENILRYEYTNTDGDMAPVQNHGLFPRGSSGLSLDYRGYSRMKAHSVSLETNIDTSLGNGQITNIAGYRVLKEYDSTDSDASPSPTFNVRFGTRTQQYSDELRYSGKFKVADLTIGAFVIQDDVDYVEARDLFGNTVHLLGGGSQKAHSWAVFGQTDVHLTPDLTLNLGARYSEEKKSAGIQKITAAAALNASCDIDAISCSNPNFSGAKTWGYFTPKLGLQWKPSGDTMLYAFWTGANRSGGYSLRWTSGATPGPFDQETQHSYEIGLKQSFFDRKVQFDAALFRNDITGMIRDVIVSDPNLGLQQTLTNTADGWTQGFEGELSARVSPWLKMSAFVGYVEAKYTKILFDISGDGVVNAIDLGLKPPRLSPWSAGANLNYTGKRVDAYVNYTYRDAAFSNDNNKGVLRSSYLLDAGITHNLTSDIKVSVYGRNLFNRIEWALDTPLPFIPNGSYSPLRKGRVVGVSLSWSM